MFVQDISGYSRLGQLSSNYVMLSHVISGYVKLVKER